MVPTGRAICNRFNKNKVIRYMNTGILDARIVGIYRHMLRMNYPLVKEMLNDTIYILNTAELEDKKLANMFIPYLYRALVELSLKRYQNAHSFIREIHYTIYGARLDA